MTEFELIQRLNFEIDQLEILSLHLKELAKHYKNEREYCGEKDCSIRKPLTIEPIINMYKIHKDTALLEYHLSFIHKQLEKTQKRLEELNEDIALNGVKL